MATTSVVVRPRTALRPKYFVFGLFAFMLAYVLVHNESFLFHPKDPIWQHYRPFRWWLLPHALAGSCAILLGPMQFSDRLRWRFAKLHRVIGRIYVFGAFVVAPLGTYIQYFEERMGAPRSFSVAAAVDAALLMITTGIAFAFIRAGKIQPHRHWMTRSFAVALIFLEVRVISGLGGWDASPRVGETIVWVCLSFSVLAGDIALQIEDYLRSRPLRRARAAAAD
jgi:uncharacterized membrane protein